MKKIITFLSLALLLSGCGAAYHQHQQQWQSGVKTEVEPEVIEQAKEILTNRMKDPSSTLFPIDPYALKYQNGTIVVCGKVNAKNSYGGYTGAKIFYVNPISSHVFIFNQNDTSSHTFKDLYTAKDCARYM